MKNKPLEENISELSAIIKRYLEARLNLFKAQVLEKTSEVGTYFFSVVLGVVVLSSLILLLTFAFTFWYGEKYGSLYEGFLISAGIYAFLGVVIYLFRRLIFTDNIIKNLGKILFIKDKDDDDNAH